MAQPRMQPGMGPPGPPGTPGPPGPPRHGIPFGAGGSKPKNFQATIRRLWNAFGREKRILPVIFLILLVDIVLMLLAPYGIGKAVDAMSEGGVQSGMFGLIVCALLLAYFASGVLSLLQGWMVAGISQRVVKRLRSALFAKLQKLPVAFFDSRTHGEVMSRLSNDIDNVSMTISQSTAQLMSGGLMIAGSLGMMLVLSPILTLTCLVTVPLVWLLTKSIAKRTRVLFKEQQIQLGKLNGQIEETISGIHVVKAFNQEQNVIAQFEETNRQLLKVGLKAQILSGFLMPFMNVINNLGFALVAIVGGVLAVEDMITVGVIASFLTYSRQFVRPLNEVANLFNLLQSGVAGAERVFEVLDEQEEAEDVPNAVALTNPRGHVVFDRVSFGYKPDQPILHEVSFEAKAGSITALVGPTGAGKTTIVNLLTRFYDVTDGAVYLDGRDIREYTRDSLRSCFGFVLQDTYLFSGTIRENIRYGKPDATDAEVEEAARLANADPFIRKLPKGYDTLLSENGSNLSQGQRQLLAIARVILAKPALLILDEATSSIDTRTEIHIQEALLKLMKGRTSFVIAHRLNTIRDADNIMVVDEGRIVEQGSHDELMAKRGVYYRMFSSQFAHAEASQ